MPFDPLLPGIEDDASATGLTVVRTAIGDLVYQPFSYGRVQMTTDATTYGTFRFGLLGENGQGDGFALNGQVPQGISHYMRLRHLWYGRVYGLVWNIAQTCSRFSVMIDGRAFRIDTAYRQWDSQVGASTILSDSNLMVLASDMPEGRHLTDIYIMGSDAGAQAFELHGYVVEKRAGYTEKPRSSYLGKRVAVPNAAPDNLDLTAYSTYRTYQTVSQIIYYNLSGVDVNTPGTDRVVRLFNGTNATPIDAFIVPAGRVVDGKLVDNRVRWTCNTPIGIDSTFYHEASGAGVVCTPVVTYR